MLLHVLLTRQNYPQLIAFTIFSVFVAIASGQNACVPSNTTLCFTHSGGTPGYYLVNGNARGELTLVAGVQYTLQVTGSKFATYPLGLTKDANRASILITDGVSGKNPASQDGDKLMFTPSNVGNATIYYQALSASGLGGRLTIKNTCAPLLTNVCVYHDGQLPGSYLILTGTPPLGDGLMSQGIIEATVGKPLTIEVVGDFSAFPLAITNSPTGPATQMTLVTTGVTGNVPATKDDDKIVLNFPAVGPSMLYYQSVSHPGMGGQISIIGACIPSSTHICVRHDGSKYTVDTGSGPVAGGQLTLSAGVSYTFESAAPEGVFEAHPLALTLSSSIATIPFMTSITSGRVPADKDDVTFTITPSPQGPATLYYQSMSDSGLGGTIKIINTCTPSETNICVTYVNGRYWIDQGESQTGAIRQGTLIFEAGKAYTFEITGPGFKTCPFGLSVNPTGRADPLLTTGVAGNSPATADDMKLTFTPPTSGIEQVWYGCTNATGVGGLIRIINTCTPTRSNFCVTFDGGNPGNFLINGAKNGDVALNATQAYSFQVVGPAFRLNSFALSLTNTLPFQPLIDGVSGDNPATDDAEKLVFVPEVVGASLVYYTSPNSQAKGGRILIKGSCMPTKTHICVTHTGGSPGSFMLNNGDDYLSVERAIMTLQAGTRYEFEATGIGSTFSRNPFALSLTQQGPILQLFNSSSISGPNPLTADGQVLVFTPPSTGFAFVYYGSTRNTGQGGRFDIAGTCNPSHTNICVKFQDGAFWVNQGQGYVKNGNLTLYVGTQYRFEVLGKDFETRPLALTLSSTGRATQPLTTNVYGDNPAAKDDDRLVFIPDLDTPQRIYYQSQQQYGLGGQISILPGPNPNPESPSDPQPQPLQEPNPALNLDPQEQPEEEEQQQQQSSSTGTDPNATGGPTTTETGSTSATGEEHQGATGQPDNSNPTGSATDTGSSSNTGDNTEAVISSTGEDVQNPGATGNTNSTTAGNTIGQTGSNTANPNPNNTPTATATGNGNTGRPTATGTGNNQNPTATATGGHTGPVVNPTLTGGNNQQPVSPEQPQQPQKSSADRTAGISAEASWAWAALLLTLTAVNGMM